MNNLDRLQVLSIYSEKKVRLFIWGFSLMITTQSVIKILCFWECKVWARLSLSMRLASWKSRRMGWTWAACPVRRRTNRESIWTIGHRMNWAHESPGRKPCSLLPSRRWSMTISDSLASTLVHTWFYFAKRARRNSTCNIFWLLLVNSWARTESLKSNLDKQLKSAYRF